MAKPNPAKAHRLFLSHVRYFLCILGGCFFLLWGGVDPANAATVNCQANRPDANNVIYLYYATTNDSNLPDNIGDIGLTTSPLPPFDVNDLDSSIGTTAEFRAAITERLKVDYCEFDVRIVPTTSDNGTTNPPPSDPRWQVIGIGSDAESGNFFGVAEDVDIGDSELTDFSRVWGSSFKNVYGGAGQALGGVNSTFERWVNAIASTTSHEAGHNFGLAHSDSASQPTEDPQSNHILATSSDLTGEDRVEERHFSDTSFEILAANIGLFEQTVSNWDFVNPNDRAADGFQITVLVLPSDGTPSKASVYTGGLSPWEDISIADDGTESFKGITYNRYTIDFVSPKSWNNGPDGEIPAGEEFHVGVGLTTNYIVRDTLLTSGGSALELNPRVVGYTTGGSFDPSSGNLHVTFSNPDPENGPLVLSDFLIRYIPRTVDINEMVSGGELQGIDGLPVNPWDIRGTDQKNFQISDTKDVTVGNLAENRAVNFIREANQCERGINGPPPVEDAAAPFSIEYCPEGNVIGLFPSTRVYFEATVTDPDAQYFDPTLKKFVQGPLQSRIFVQLPGVKPDLNDNGVDDSIDIATEECEDKNKNGVCDDVEPKFKYAAKVVCGIQKDPKNMQLAKGFYGTSINIHNSEERETIFSKKLALSIPPGKQQPGQIFPIAKDRLDAYQALAVDCEDIKDRVFDGEFPAPFIEGFIDIKSPTSLDVTGVYTAASLDHKGEKAKDHSSIHVEQIRERSNLKSLPDLVVSSINGLDINCPRGSRSCVSNLSVTIANEGLADADAFNTRVTLDPAQSVIVDHLSPEGLAAGTSETFTITTPPGGNCFDPDCTICVHVDDKSTVSELLETNNNLCETRGG